MSNDFKGAKTLVYPLHDRCPPVVKRNDPRPGDNYEAIMWLVNIHGMKQVLAMMSPQRNK